MAETPDRVIPNFFIVGAPKCGTTALVHYLRDHPDVFLSEPKEPNYFCSDFPRLTECRDLDEYLALFSAAGTRKVVGEASTWYLHSELAAPAILQFNPQARFIAMVRNPVEMLYSLYSQYRFNGSEKRSSFEEAWNMQSPGDRPLLRYEQIGKLGMQIQRLRERVPAAQLMVVVFDDLRADPKGVYERVLSFLGLVSDGRTDFAVVNQNKQLRSGRLGDFIRNTPGPVLSAVSTAKRVLGIQKLGIMERVLKFNTRKSSRDPLPQAFVAGLRSTYRDDVRLLGRLLDRDLSGWLEK